MSIGRRDVFGAAGCIRPKAPQVLRARSINWGSGSRASLASLTLPSLRRKKYTRSDRTDLICTKPYIQTIPTKLTGFVTQKTGIQTVPSMAGCYHLNSKFSLGTGNAEARFFRFLNGENTPRRHRVQFPILASTVATLREARNQFLWPTGPGAGALVFSVVALCFSLAELTG